MKSEISKLDSFNADLFKEELEKDLHEYFHSSNKLGTKNLMPNLKFESNSSYHFEQIDFGDLSSISNQDSINLNEGKLGYFKTIDFTEIGTFEKVWLLS